MARHDIRLTVNGVEQKVNVESRLLLVHRHARPDRHPLGLRHVQLRCLHRLDGRGGGQVVHRPHRSG